jgi:hypothetical protein
MFKSPQKITLPSKEFKKFNKSQKLLALKKGKEIIRNKVNGQYDSSLPYMLKSQFRKSNKNIFGRPFRSSFLQTLSIIICQEFGF